MTVRGLENIQRNLIKAQETIHLRLETRMQMVAVALKQWSIEEHSWQNDRPHTESTIDAFLTENSADKITTTLSVDLDSGMWLELAHEGKWAWMWNVLVTHREEILEMLGANYPGNADLERNPNVQSEYEDRKGEMYADRQSTMSSNRHIRDML